jgi:DNA-binding GntR family transcriptional regulator
VTAVSLDDLSDLVRARVALEPVATSLAASRFSEAAELSALSALDRYREAIRRDQFGAVMAADREFHFVIYDEASSPWLRRLINTTWESAERYRRLMVPERSTLQEREHEHRDILRACAEGDETKAAELMSRHLRHSANSISRKLAGSPLYPDDGG